MEKGNKINTVLSNLSLDKNSHLKLEQIALISNKILEILEKIAQNSEKYDFDKTYVYGNGVESFIKQKISKERYKDTDFINGINWQEEDKSYIVSGLKYYTVNEFKIENLTEKQVVITYDDNTVNYDKAHNLNSTKMMFNFNKKNALETIEVKKTSNQNLRTTVKSQVFSKDQVRKMLGNSEQKQSTAELLF